VKRDVAKHDGPPRALAPRFLLKRQHSGNDNGSSRPGQGSVITPAPAARGKGAFYRVKKRNAYELWRGWLAASVTMIF
jgi:hypothetical protein